MDELEKEKNSRNHFEKLFREYSDVVYRLCLYKTSNEEVANDLTQETFTRLWKTISSGSDIENPKSYIYQIARNLIVDFYKSKKAVSLDMLAEEGFDQKSEMASAEMVSEVSILKEAIESLDEEFRDVIYMKFVEGFKVKEISAILEISENLVSVRINRGKNMLKNIFE